MEINATELIFGLLGGLALFIYGMGLMGDSLQKAAGDRLKGLLEFFTSNPITAIIVGAVTTAIIQSSSATTVMVVGFVNARLMTLTQAIGVIMGANIGTTITAQLIAFKLGDYAFLIVAIGFAITFFSRRKSHKHIGNVILGFGILFVGLNTMSHVLTPLADSPFFVRLITGLGHKPILGVLVGTIMTMVVQSSSATIGVLQTLASQPVVVDGVIQALIPFTTALPILFGSNIGTTITAVLASVGANITARRAAFAHVLFNILGTIVFLLILPLFGKLVLLMSPHSTNTVTEATIISRQIANAHTLFNILNTLIWFPFIGFLAKLVVKVLPGEDVFIDRGAIYLDRRMIKSPGVALELAIKELVRMSEVAAKMVTKSQDAFMQYKRHLLEEVEDLEDIVDHLQKEIVTYLSKVLSQSALSEEQSTIMTGLMHVTGDIERVGDHAHNIVQLAEMKFQDGVAFSDEARNELSKMFGLIDKIFYDAMTALRDHDVKLAKKVLAEEEEVDTWQEKLRTGHMERLNTGKCSPEAGIIYFEIVSNLERIADHSNNIAEVVIDGLRRGISK